MEAHVDAKNGGPSQGRLFKTLRNYLQPGLINICLPGVSPRATVFPDDISEGVQTNTDSHLRKDRCATIVLQV